MAILCVWACTRSLDARFLVAYTVFPLLNKFSEVRAHCAHVIACFCWV